MSIETLGTLALRAGHDLQAIPERRTATAPTEDAAIKAMCAYSETGTGVHVSESNALCYIPALACVRVISETWGCMPLKIYRRTADGPEVADGHYLYTLLHDEPNPEMSAFSFWEAAGVSLGLYNHFFAEIEWNQAGRVKALWPLLPDRVFMRRAPGGRLVYDCFVGDGGPVTLDSADVLHIPGCLSINGVAAQSLIHWGREAIGLGLAPERFAANFYRNNARPGFVLKSPKNLNTQQREELREAWDSVHAGLQGAGRTGVLEGGLDISTYGTPQKDAEFSETRYQQMLMACAMWRVPPHMIADLRHATYSNIEHSDIGFAKHTMTPYCKRGEQAVNRKLIGLRTGFYAEFLMDGLMRGDLSSRAEAQARMVQTGLLMPNEGRAMENRRRAAGGDRLFIQGATVPIESAGAQGQIAA